MKVVIADDEYYARKAMAKKILQVDPDIEILGDFENGLQVMSFLEEHGDEIDVLITDIRMPEMDGLYLAQYLFEQESSIQTIIISGYNEFDYAKKAIGFGVSNYLLKPVQKEELKAAFDKISREQKRYQNNIQDVMIQKTLPFLSIQEISSHGEWKKIFFEPVFKRNKDKKFCLAVIQNKDKKNWIEDRKVQSMLNRIQYEFQGEQFYFNRFQEYVFLLFGDKERIADSLQHFIKQADILGIGTVTAGMSQSYTTIEQCTKAYQEAIYAINQRLVEGWGKIYIYSSDFKPENLLDKEKEQMLLEAIREKRTTQAEMLCREIMGNCHNSYTLYVTISGIFNLLYRLFCRNENNVKQDMGYMLFSYRTDLYSYHTMEEIQDYVGNIVKIMCEEQSGKKYHYIVSEILNDITRNYQENISIGELAEHKYFMNSSYLSRLFKQETGKTFSNYLMEYRMQKAKEFLESNLLKISDVAMLSGYNDVSRFIQHFKKMCGMTPNEYKNWA